MSQKGYEIDFSAQSDTLLCTFCGMWLSDAKPGFTFVKTSQNLPVKRVFFTDIDQIWYMNGIRGIGDQISDVVDFIKQVIRAEKIERVIFVGDSAGGYAAILYGILADADCILAFSPQTNLSQSKYTSFKDRIKILHRDYTNMSQYFNLQDIIGSAHDPNNHISIHYSKYHLRDFINARELYGHQSVDLVGYPMFTHTVPSALKNFDYLGYLFKLTLCKRTSYRIKLSVLDKINFLRYSLGYTLERVQSVLRK